MQTTRPALALMLGILALSSGPSARAQEPQPDPRDARLDELERRLGEQARQLDDQSKKLDEQAQRLHALEPAPGATPPGATPPGATPGAPASGAPGAPPAEKAWYDKLSIKGYVQLRYTALASDPHGPWFHPADRSVSRDTTFLLRRGRISLSGQLTDHVFVYIQPELYASLTDGDFAVQMRDLYADISLDDARELRFRVGQTKVPFGFTNVQSSGTRIALERADAFDSALEGQRDLGVFFYWAPAAIRERFKHLVSKGLKGSGDFGVLALGAYTGQGANRLDLNSELHYVARLSYPFEVSDQIFELGVQGYIGRFVPKNGPLPNLVGAGTVTPDFPGEGLEDRRVAVTAVLFPQPFGFAVEWTAGRGPVLKGDRSRIEVDTVHGGYAEVNLKLDTGIGTVIPFVRWQYMEGGRKFARNAPREHVRELDGGVEWSPLKELELTIVYTYTQERTDTSTPPFPDLTDAHRVGFQLQWNF